MTDPGNTKRRGSLRAAATEGVRVVTCISHSGPWKPGGGPGCGSGNGCGGAGVCLGSGTGMTFVAPWRQISTSSDAGPGSATCSRRHPDALKATTAASQKPSSLSRFYLMLLWHLPFPPTKIQPGSTRVPSTNLWSKRITTHPPTDAS